MTRVNLVVCVWFALFSATSMAHAQVPAADSEGPVEAVSTSPEAAPRAPPAPSAAPLAPSAAPLAPLAPLEPSAAPLGAPSVDPARLAAAQQLSLVDFELAQERRRHPRIGIPIAMISVGYVTTLFGTLAVIVIAQEGRQDGYRWDEQGNRSRDRWFDASSRAPLAQSTIITAFGMGVGAVGAWLLARSVKERRAQRRKLEPLRRRRLELLHQLGYALNVDKRQLALAASVRF